MKTEKTKAKNKSRVNFLYRTKYLPAYLAFIALYPFGLEDLPGELWCWIRGYEGLYQINNYGRIKSFPRKFTVNGIRIRKPLLSMSGYLQINLSKDHKAKYFMIHRLVAEAFVPNPQNKPQVKHKFGHKFDSYFGNLEWVTQSENQQHAVDTGLQKSGIDNSRAKLTKEDVRYIREHYKPHDTEFSGVALAKKFNVGCSTMRRVINGETYKNID